MYSELQELLEKHGFRMFEKFLQTFGFSYWRVERDHYNSNIRSELLYKEEETGELMIITVSNGDEYIFYKCSLVQLTKDFKRFLNLKAFL